jgi:hypothetical protein
VYDAIRKFSHDYSVPLCFLYPKLFLDNRFNRFLVRMDSHCKRAVCGSSLTIELEFK